MNGTERLQRLASAMNADRQCLEAYQEARQFLRRSGTTGVSIGVPRKAGKWQDDQQAVCVHVAEKLPRSELDRRRLLPRKIAGTRIDVIQSNFRRRGLSTAELTARQWLPALPIQPGVQISTRTGDPGTLGLFVYDRTDGALCALSVEHVLSGPAQTPVLQPGWRNAALALGRIRRSMRTCDGEAAIAVVEAGRPTNAVPLGLGAAPTGIAGLRAGMRLVKSGATTGVTQATVKSAGSYEVSGLCFNGFLLAPLNDHDISEIAAQGDSGSVWIDQDTGNAVGMTIGGEPNDDWNAEEWVIVCPLDLVFQKLGISLSPPPFH
jgi:hypothetical protein